MDSWKQAETDQCFNDTNDTNGAIVSADSIATINSVATGATANSVGRLVAVGMG